MNPLVSSSRFYLVICVPLVLFLACGGGEPGEVDTRSVEPLLLKLAVGDSDDPITVTFRIDPGTTVKKEGSVRFFGAVTDFAIPFNKLGKQLTRSWIGGEPLISDVWLTNTDDDGRTPLVFRYTAKGTGGGEGNLGTSIVLAFCLDKEIFNSAGTLVVSTPLAGKLTAAGGAIENLYTIIEADLQAVGAKSPTYTQLAGMGPKDAMFNGFVVFDPTNPESIGNAYFEFASSQSTRDWKLEQLEETK